MLAAGLAPACSQGQGSGTVEGVLNIPDCWVGNFNLHPNFFAALPNTNQIGVQATTAVQIRIQNGSDYEGFSDGLLISVDDVAAVRPNLLGEPLVVSEPASVVPPGDPVPTIPNPPIVHATMYLNKTCATTNDALYALSAVSLGADGTCGNVPPANCGSPAIAGAPEAGVAPDASASLDGGTSTGPVGESTIIFNSLFDGNSDEPNAAARLTDATFTFYLADPREGCPGGVGPPPPCRGFLTGNFRFYFQRGSPAQPFP
jgi:hypothetical protein